VTRVAVQAGTAWVRVAVDEPRPRLLAELPAAEANVESALGGLFGVPVAELRIVHPAGLPPPVPPGVAEMVRAVPVAVAAWTAACPGHEPAVVVDVGRTGAEIALVLGGRVALARGVAVGGAALDVVASGLLPASVEPAVVRRVRESLSLRPVVCAGPAEGVTADELRTALAGPVAEVVDAVRAVLRAVGSGRAPPVLLVGGIARTPLLAELLDAAKVGGVRVLPRPDSAAVLGALRVPAALLEPVPVLPSGADRPAGVRADTPAGIGAEATWLPTPPHVRRRPTRVVLGTLAVAAATAALVGAGAALPPTETAPRPSAGHLIQYGYAVRLPAGWAHTGGLPERRRSLLTPVAAPDGSDLISVERTSLGYDADVEPRRARAELRAEFTAAVAAGAPLSDFDDDVQFAGRPVVAYREAGGGEAGEVDWYVVLDADAQLSVGCRHTSAGTGSVRAACATVVASLHRTS
jgi:type VII secretion-associated protein (TIGR03931 family)